MVVTFLLTYLNKIGEMCVCVCVYVYQDQKS